MVTRQSLGASSVLSDISSRCTRGHDIWHTASAELIMDVSCTLLARHGVRVVNKPLVATGARGSASPEANWSRVQVFAVGRESHRLQDQTYDNNFSGTNTSHAHDRAREKCPGGALPRSCIHQHELRSLPSYLIEFMSPSAADGFLGGTEADVIRHHCMVPDSK